MDVWGSGWEALAPVAGVADGGCWMELFHPGLGGAKGKAERSCCVWKHFPSHPCFTPSRVLTGVVPKCPS